MKIWKSAVLCTAVAATLAVFPMRAQDATSGGDQQPQADAQGSMPANGGGRRMPGAQNDNFGRRGGGVRGTVTAVSGSSVTLKNEQGETWTVLSTDNTRVRRDGQPGALNAVKAGDEMMAMGMPDADKHEVHAVVIVDISAAEVAKAKANMGKTYITGRITAINETQLTIMRTDKVSQVITLDESTSLHRGGRIDPAAMQAAGLDVGMGGGMGPGGGGRRGGNADGPPQNEAGESITLADVKVGDMVVGLGAVKGGNFVPTDLHVQNRPMGGGRRGGMNGGGTDAPPQQ